MRRPRQGLRREAEHGAEIDRREEQVGFKRSCAVGLCLVVCVAAGCGGNDGAPSSGAGSSAMSPSTQPSSPAAGGAREAGREACRGMNPLEAALHFEDAAREAGATERFIELVTEPAPTVERSPGYPRLVGAFYSTTLPPAQRGAAAAGCAEELAARG